MDDPPLLALAYLRKSRDPKERADPDLLARHRDILGRLAAADGAALREERIFAEIRSGEHLSARPEFRRLLALLAALPPGTAPVLYCIDVDRLGRGVATERGLIQDALAAAGVTIRTPAGVIRLANADETLLYEVKGSLARHELLKYKERVEMKRQEQVRRAEIRTGKAPWGYVWDRNVPGRGVLRPHPERFPVLQDVCREIRTTSLRRLSASYGVPHSTLQTTLRNPTICGWPARRHIAGHPEARRSDAPLPRAAWVWPEQPGDYPAACTRPEWEAIQIVLDHRWCLKGKTGFDDDGWARNVVRFNDDPAPARLSSARRQLLYERSGGAAGECHVSRGSVHAVVLATLQRVFSAPEAVLTAFESRQALPPAADPTAACTAELARLRAALDRLTEERLGIEDAEGRASQARVQAKIKQQIRAVQADLERAHRAAPPAADLGVVAEILPDLCASFPAVWPELTGEEKRALVNACIEQVPVRVWLPEGKVRHRREVGEPLLLAWLHGNLSSEPAVY